MLNTVYFILSRDTQGLTDCQGLRFDSPESTSHEWDFPAQASDLEAVMLALDSYPPMTGAQLADLTFLDSHDVNALFSAENKSDLFRLVRMSAVPLREWLASKGRYLVNVAPCFALAIQEENGHWRLSPNSVTQDASMIRQPPPATRGANGRSNMTRWVEITHRGIRLLPDSTSLESMRPTAQLQTDNTPHVP